MAELILTVRSDSEESEDDEQEQEEGTSEDDEDKHEREKRDKKERKENKEKSHKFVTGSDLSHVRLKDDQRALIQSVHQSVSATFQQVSASPVSTVIANLTDLLALVAPQLERLMALRSGNDREVAMRTQELADLVNLMVSAEAALQGLKSMRSFCLQRSCVVLREPELASTHPTITLPFDFATMKRYGLLCFVGTKGIASARLSSVSVWLLLCNETKDHFLTISGNLGSKKFSYAQGAVEKTKKGALHELHKKVAAKMARGFSSEGCAAECLARALTENLNVSRAFTDWKVFKPEPKNDPELANWL
jgi:hypothetical protein